MSIKPHPLIHINGRQGVGKKTVATLLAQKIKGLVIDNHIIINAALVMHGYGNESFSKLNQKIRKAVYADLKAKLWECPIVLTNAFIQESEDDHQNYADIKQTAESAGSTFLPVILEATFEENLKRVQEPSRKLSRKFTEEWKLSKFYNSYSVLHQASDPVIDTTYLEADETACLMAEMLTSRSPTLGKASKHRQLQGMPLS